METTNGNLKKVDITIPEVKITLDKLGENCFNELKALNPKGGLKEFIRLAVNYGYNAKSKEKLYTEKRVAELCYDAMKERSYTPYCVFKEWFNFNKK